MSNNERTEGQNTLEQFKRLAYVLNRYKDDFDKGKSLAANLRLLARDNVFVQHFNQALGFKPNQSGVYALFTLHNDNNTFALPWTTDRAQSVLANIYIDCLRGVCDADWTYCKPELIKDAVLAQSKGKNKTVTITPTLHALLEELDARFLHLTAHNNQLFEDYLQNKTNNLTEYMPSKQVIVKAFYDKIKAFQNDTNFAQTQIQDYLEHNDNCELLSRITTNPEIITCIQSEVNFNNALIQSFQDKLQATLHNIDELNNSQDAKNILAMENMHKNSIERNKDKLQYIKDRHQRKIDLQKAIIENEEERDLAWEYEYELKTKLAQQTQKLEAITQKGETLRKTYDEEFAK